jgi:hypothetical protein
MSLNISWNGHRMGDALKDCSIPFLPSRHTRYSISKYKPHRFIRESAGMPLPDNEI